MKDKEISKMLVKLTSSFAAFFFIIIFFSCSPTKHLKQDELFLKKNKIKVNTRKLDSDNLNSIIKRFINIIIIH